MRKPWAGEAEERRRWWDLAGAGWVSSAEDERAEEREVATMIVVAGGQQTRRQSRLLDHCPIQGEIVEVKVLQNTTLVGQGCGVLLASTCQAKSTKLCCRSVSIGFDSPDAGTQGRRSMSHLGTAFVAPVLN